MTRNSGQNLGRKNWAAGQIGKLIHFAVMALTNFSTGVTQGAVAALQIKIRTAAKSSHVQLSKAVLRPLPARVGAQRLKTICSYGRDPRPRQGSTKFNERTKDSGKFNNLRRKTPPSPETIKIVVREYAVPTIGVLALATILGPIIGAVALSAFGFALAIAATVAAFSLSWIFIPVILSFMGLPLLFGGGIATSLFAGAAGVLLFPTLLNIGLITAAVYLGVNVARSFLGAENNGPGDGEIDYDGTIDIEAETFHDSIEREMETEAKRREQELREFDELLRRRERFQRGGGGGGGSSG